MTEILVAVFALGVVSGAIGMYCWIYYTEVRKRRNYLPMRWKPQEKRWG